ncbi:MAG: ATP-binding protein, partial [Solirubrobacterales bacterium]
MLDGRTDERRWHDARLGSLNEGGCFAAVVRGEAGVGKSALVAAAVDDLVGVRVLRTRGYEADADIPFAGLLELVAPLLERRDELPIAQRDALASAFALAPPSAHDRFAVPAGLLGLIGLAAADGPVLVTVDDAHWLDDASRDAIRFVARRLAVGGGGILLAVRDDAGPALDLSGLDELVLGGLDGESAARLVRRHWPQLPAATVGALVAATAGNPLALLEVPGVLTAAQRDGNEPLTDPLPTTAAVERAFAQQLEALPATVRRALVLAAAASRGGVDALTAGLRELGLPDDALQDAERAGVVGVVDGCLA